MMLSAANFLIFYDSREVLWTWRGIMTMTVLLYAPKMD